MSPQRVNRILTISASLLPEEISAARRARRAGLWVAVVVVLVAGLCAAWFTVAYQQTRAAESDLEAASVAVADLQRKQAEYSETVRIQNGIATLSGQLKAVMANDLDWDAMLDTVRHAGTRSGIQVDGVNGRLNTADGAAATEANPLPGTSTEPLVGSLVVTGTGPDKRAVAAYVDALAKETVLANPFVTSVTREGENEDRVTFSLTADITQAALCGRFTTKCTGGN
ncbi:hypothetical protein Adi01nite_53630 [Amorphoplanes digitatis]|nr:hypothetical protein GCM10020092_096290 [Actinoplanes digitatis]GID95951.1 hypothetical protein Adi01nite_53630 [Actinoplanes digitatis]